MTAEKQGRQRDWTGPIIVAAVAPVYFVLHFLGKEDMGRTASLVLGMSLLAVRLRWDLRKQVWFWGTVIVLFSLQLPLILMIRWPHRWISGVELMPIGLGDLLITLGCIWLVEKLTIPVTGSMNSHR
jgi:hypothetical protein